MVERTHRDVDGLQVAVEVDTLEFVTQRIISAGLLLNGRLDGPQLSKRVEAVTGQLDEAMRAIRLMALHLRSGRRDLDQLVVRLGDVADDVSHLAKVQRDDGPAHFLGEAARHLHRARMALAETQEQSREAQLS